MITLSDIRRALEQALTHASNPALLRLPENERTAEGLARAYLPRVVWTQRPEDERGWCGAVWADQIGMLGAGRTTGTLPLDLTDPGTAHAVVVALALALGLDPGPAGLCAAWRPLYATDADGRRRVGWWLSTVDEAVYYVTAADTTGDDDEVANEAIADEPDPIKALSLALLRTLEAT